MFSWYFIVFLELIVINGLYGVTGFFGKIDFFFVLWYIGGL